MTPTNIWLAMAKAVSALKGSKKLSTNFSGEGSKTVTAKTSGKI